MSGRQIEYKPEVVLKSGAPSTRWNNPQSTKQIYTICVFWCSFISSQVRKEPLNLNVTPMFDEYLNRLN